MTDSSSYNGLIENALHDLKFGMDFAYEKGLHEFGYDPVEVVRSALSPPPQQTEPTEANCARMGSFAGKSTMAAAASGFDPSRDCNIFDSTEAVCPRHGHSHAAPRTEPTGLVERVAAIIDPDAFHESVNPLPKDGLATCWMDRRHKARAKAIAITAMQGDRTELVAREAIEAARSSIREGETIIRRDDTNYWLVEDSVMVKFRAAVAKIDAAIAAQPTAGGSEG